MYDTRFRRSFKAASYMYINPVVSESEPQVRFLVILQHLVHSDQSLSTECLWSSSRAQTRHNAIAPHWSPSYPEYLSTTQDQTEQRRVVWSRLHNHRVNLAKRLLTTKEQYLAAHRELNPKMTQVESSHDPLYRDSITCIIAYPSSSNMLYKVTGHRED